MPKFKCNINFILLILIINVVIITLLKLSLNLFKPSNIWFISIILLNIQTLLTTSIISYPFYNYHRIYRFYLTSIIITSIFSGFLFWFYVNNTKLDIIIVIISIYLGLIVNILDLVVFRTIYEISCRHNNFIKKMV
jgi:hypothetical protein